MVSAVRDAIAGEATVRVENVYKRFGSVEALRGVSYTARPGEILYILGPNGSGKTTLVRVTLGLYSPDRGVVEVLGARPGSGGWERVRSQVGYVPENADVYERLTGAEIIGFYARIYGGRNWRRLAERAARISGLSGKELARRAGEYSKGMRRRLLLAIALMHEPRIVFLDEPFSGVDVISAHRIRMILSRLRSGGSSVIATSHNVFEAERHADRILFIYKGVKLFEGTVEEAHASYNASTLEEAFVKAVEGAGIDG
ncbi:MAG: ABC transporter ATP-binding protein [Desulfurococcales archaeon]|nr:ABC transporter ATP-binding protein [Desulfurococcales archaeon]